LEFFELLNKIISKPTFKIFSNFGMFKFSLKPANKKSKVDLKNNFINNGKKLEYPQITKFMRFKII